MRASRKKPPAITERSREQGKWLWIGGVTVAALCVIVIPLVLVLLNWRSSLHNAPPASTVAVVTTAAAPAAYQPCDGKIVGPISVGSTPILINPANVCNVNLRVYSGRAYIGTSYNNKELGPEGLGHLGDFKIEEVWATTSEATLIYALCPKGMVYGDNGCEPRR